MNKEPKIVKAENKNTTNPYSTIFLLFSIIPTSINNILIMAMIPIMVLYRVMTLPPHFQLIHSHHTPLILCY